MGEGEKRQQTPSGGETVKKPEGWFEAILLLLARKLGYAQACKRRMYN